MENGHTKLFELYKTRNIEHKGPDEVTWILHIDFNVLHVSNIMLVFHLLTLHSVKLIRKLHLHVITVYVVVSHKASHTPRPLMFVVLPRCVLIIPDSQQSSLAVTSRDT
jgi:hypothetical protein